MDEKIAFGQKLLEERKKAGKSQAEIAQLLGITTAAYQNYENGRREAGYATISKLADFYNVTTDYLLGREPAPNPFGDLGLDEAGEQEMLRQYMSFEPEVRAMLMDVLIKLADSAKPEESPPDIVETTTVGAVLDRRAAMQAEAEAQDDGVA
jgi:transcriptional regulator with XRE-family HTH domain